MRFARELRCTAIRKSRRTARIEAATLLDTSESQRCNGFASARTRAAARPRPEHLQSHRFLRRETFVNKTELIEHIARQADISKAAASRALEAVIGGVKTSLKKNNTVSLVGFGTFSVGKRAARSGRNPRTGAAIKIKAAKIPKFRPGKALKDALN
jgi:DNA-binding protein HU-beta